MTDKPPVDPRSADPLHFAGRVTQCRWCSAATNVVWVITEKSQLEGHERKTMPIEAGINPDGNAEILLPAPGSDEPPLVRIHGDQQDLFAPDDEDTWVPYMPHHATCSRNLQKGPRS